MIEGLEVSKQAASQLIDTLVLRGYLRREVNPEDRRPMTIELTERGRAAAAAVRSAIEAIGAELDEMPSPAELPGCAPGWPPSAASKGVCGRNRARPLRLDPGRQTS